MVSWDARTNSATCTIRPEKELLKVTLGRLMAIEVAVDHMKHAWESRDSWSRAEHKARLQSGGRKSSLRIGHRKAAMDGLRP